MEEHGAARTPSTAKLNDGLTPSQSDINTQQRPVCPRLTPDVMITYFPSTTTKVRGSEFGAACRLQQTCSEPVAVGAGDGV